MTTKTNTEIIAEYKNITAPPEIIALFKKVNWTPEEGGVMDTFISDWWLKHLETKDQHNKDTCEKMMREILEIFEGYRQPSGDLNHDIVECITSTKTIAKSYGVETT